MGVNLSTLSPLCSGPFSPNLREGGPSRGRRCLWEWECEPWRLEGQWIPSWHPVVPLLEQPGVAVTSPRGCEPWVGGIQFPVYLTCIHSPASPTRPQVCFPDDQTGGCSFPMPGFERMLFLVRGPGKQAGILPIGTLTLCRRILAEQASYMLLLNFSNNYFNIFISSLGGSSSSWSDMNCRNQGDFAEGRKN